LTAGRPEPRSGNAAPEAPPELPRMSLFDHLEELRQRLLKVVIALAVGMALCLSWAPELCRWLARPIYEFLPEGTKLAFLGVTDPFVLYFKTALLAGAFLAFPVILWQVWGFISPGLYAKERRWAGPFVFSGWFFFVLGGAFAYFIAFPVTVRFLLEIAGPDFQPVITAERYYGFLLTIVLGLGLMFELPVLLVLLGKVGLVTPRFLMRNFRWAVLIIFVVSAVITPTSDIVNLSLFAVPTIGLYLLGTLGAWAVQPRRKPEPVPD
jgi:sec-independent protein translocase protein TatC